MIIDEHIKDIDVATASKRLEHVVIRTPLEYHKRLSEKYGCELYLKREDLQPVRSYKIRGAFNKISSLANDQLQQGVVCASAGNHAQGVAYSCHYLQIRGTIYMPSNTPAQKIERVKALGGNFITIVLTGGTYDEAAEAAAAFSTANHLSLIPPFDDIRVIEGQATIAKEILEDQPAIDFIFMPVGGGGLAAGVSNYFYEHSRETKLIGVEPAGAASMTAAFENGGPVALEKIDPFVDGATVKQVGKICYEICAASGLQMQTVPEGKVCSTLLQLYNEDGILAEPAGVLSIAALDDFASVIKGKKVVCILSGSNNDSNRMEEIKKLADAWEGLQHHLIIRFQHNPDGLKEFFTSVIGSSDYVNRIEYMRRDHGRSTYALVGLRCESHNDFSEVKNRLTIAGTEYREVQREDFLFKYWV